MSFECRINYNYENLKNIKRFIELGVEVYITELDVGLNLWGQGGNHKKVSDVITSQSDWNKFFEEQNKIYYNLVKTAKESGVKLIVHGGSEMIFVMVVGEKIKRHGWLIKTTLERVRTTQF